jgi:hypothetical protein
MKALTGLIPLVGLVLFASAGLAFADSDSDGDGVLDTVDNCVSASNPLQLDSDKIPCGPGNPDCTFIVDGRGDACDNCPQVLNAD